MSWGCGFGAWRRQPCRGVGWGGEMLNIAGKCFEIPRWRVLSFPERDGEAQGCGCLHGDTRCATVAANPRAGGRAGSARAGLGAAAAAPTSEAVGAKGTSAAGVASRAPKDGPNLPGEA